MKEFNSFVTKMKQIGELKEKIEAKIRKDDRVVYVSVFDTIVTISTEHHVAYYEPADTNNIVAVYPRKTYSEALLAPVTPEAHNKLESKLKAEGKWLKEYVKELFDVE
jgi:hypothetical protein